MYSSSRNFMSNLICKIPSTKENCLSEKYFTYCVKKATKILYKPTGNQLILKEGDQGTRS